MPYVLNVGELDAVMLDALAEVLPEMRDLAVDIVDRNATQPASGSAAEADLAAKIGAYPKAQPMIAELARCLASLHLLTATHHLAGAASLLRSRDVMLSPLVLARSAFENAVRGINLIDNRSTTEQRAARALIEEICSAASYRRTMEDIAGGDTTDQNAVVAQGALDAWIDVARRAFPGATIPKSLAPAHGLIVGGQRYMSLTATAGAWAEWRQANGNPEITALQARGLYGYLCLPTHPQGFTSHRVVRISDGADGIRVGGFVAEVAEISKLVLGALATTCDLARAFYGFNGWSAPELDALGDQAEELGDAIAEVDRLRRSFAKTDEI